MTKSGAHVFEPVDATRFLLIRFGLLTSTFGQAAKITAPDHSECAGTWRADARRHGPTFKRQPLIHEPLGPVALMRGKILPSCDSIGPLCGITK